MLIDAAREAGAEVRENFIVDEILLDGGRVVGIRGAEKGGRMVEERARLVVGADGKHSMVAKAVGAETYRQKPALSLASYTYWVDVPAVDGDVHPIRVAGQREGRLLAVRLRAHRLGHHRVFAVGSDHQAGPFLDHPAALLRPAYP